MVAYTQHGEVRFLSSSRLEPVPNRVCRGGVAATVTALAFDLVSPGVLYAGTQDGSILGFNTRVREADGSPACQLVYKLPGAPSALGAGREGMGRLSDNSGSPRAAEQQAGVSQLATVRGYVLAMCGQSILVYNSTNAAIAGGGVSLLFEKEMVPGVAAAAGDTETA
ncbi:unnamed protein product, partial [Discosporangium mesarthrocarpum]